MNAEKSLQTGTQVETNLFTMFRNTRADERTRDIMVYENLIATTTSAETKASAEAKLLEIRSNVEFETSAEGLILALSYNDVIVNRTNGFVNVLLKNPQNIDSIQAAQIMSTLISVDRSLDIDDVYISIM
jgi:hypothetical protein